MRRVPWVNLWMIAFGAAGIYYTTTSFFSTDFSSGKPWFELARTQVLLGLVLAVGFLPPRRLDEVAKIYTRAVKGLWQRKWMLVFFAIITAINVTASISDDVLSRHYLAASMKEKYQLHWVVHPLKSLPYAIANSIPKTVSNTLAWFMPHSGLNSGPADSVVLAVVLVLVIPWAYSRSTRFGREENGIRLVQIAMISAATLALVTLLVVPKSYIASLQQAATNSKSYPTALGSVNRMEHLWGLMRAGLVSPFLIGGLIGSLREGTEVTIDSFLKNSIRYFKPLAGTYLLLTFIGYLTWFTPFDWRYADYGSTAAQMYEGLEYTLTIIAMLLMFAPYSIVLGVVGTQRGMGIGVRTWLSNARSVVPFIAVGIAFVTPVLLIRKLVSTLIAPTSWFCDMLVPIQMAIGTLLVAVMLLAVWEFYQLISKGETVEQPEA